MMLPKMKNMAATFFFLILLLSTSVAGRRLKLGRLAEQKGDAGEVHEEVVLPEEEEESINERLLKVNTKDYGKYDPAPALVRPPFKLIPN